MSYHDDTADDTVIEETSSLSSGRQTDSKERDFVSEPQSLVHETCSLDPKRQANSNKQASVPEAQSLDAESLVDGDHHTPSSAGEHRDHEEQVEEDKIGKVHEAIDEAIATFRRDIENHKIAYERSYSALRALQQEREREVADIFKHYEDDMTAVNQERTEMISKHNMEVRRCCSEHEKMKREPYRQAWTEDGQLAEHEERTRIDEERDRLRQLELSLNDERKKRFQGDYKIRIKDLVYRRSTHGEDITKSTSKDVKEAFVRNLDRILQRAWPDFQPESLPVRRASIFIDGLEWEEVPGYSGNLYEREGELYARTPIAIRDDTLSEARAQDGGGIIRADDRKSSVGSENKRNDFNELAGQDAWSSRRKNIGASVQAQPPTPPQSRPQSFSSQLPPHQQPQGRQQQSRLALSPASPKKRGRDSCS